MKNLLSGTSTTEVIEHLLITSNVGDLYNLVAEALEVSRANAKCLVYKHVYSGENV